MDLRKNSIGDLGVFEIALAIRQTTSLVHLDLSSNELGAKGGVELFKALAVNESITSLDISSHEGLHRNHIGEKGAKNIGKVLEKNKILSILNLSGNGIRIEGLSYIAAGMAGNNTLVSLKIAQNDIQGNSQCVAYFKSLVIQSKLLELDISENPLGNNCMEDFAQILGNAGMSLKRLFCSNIGISCISDFY